MALTDKLTNIADAIREKTGSTRTMNLFSKNINNANYENATIDFFAKTYAGTITLQLYGR